LFEGVFEAAQGIATQGAAGSAGGIGDALTVIFGQAARRAEEWSGVFLQGADSELFGALEILIEVGAVAGEAFGEAKRGPVGDFVKGALVEGGVMETFCEQGAVAVFFLPGIGELPQGETEALAGEIGAAGGTGNDETTKRRCLDDELEAVGANDGIPTDPSIAVSEMLGGTGPTEDSDKLVAASFRVSLVNALPEDVSGRATGFKVVFGVKNRPKLADFQWLGGGADMKGDRLESSVQRGSWMS